MQCDVCGTEVAPTHKFCMECGARLPQPSDPTAGSGAQRSPADQPAAPARTATGHPMFDPSTGQLLTTAELPPDDPPAAALDDDDATSVVPALGPPVTTFAPPDPTPGVGLPWSTYLAPPEPPTPSPTPSTPSPSLTPSPSPSLAPPPSAEVYPDVDPNEPEVHPDAYPAAPGVSPARPDAYPAWPGDSVAAGSYEQGQYYEPTRPQYLPERYAGPPAVVDAPTRHVPTAYVPWEDQAPAGRSAPARTFAVKPLLILAIVTSVAAVVGMFADVVVIEGPGAPAARGPWKINDFGTNLTVAGIVTAVAMLVGALAWCGGYRWGAGLAGGAGAGLAGWAILPIGAAEATFSSARLGSPTAELSRELGYWCLAGAGALGLVVLVVSLARAGDDRRAGLDPWVAALGAAATITAVIGPLIPINGADIEDNWSSPAGTDFPTIFFLARFVNLGLLLLCGVVGFLLVRRYGLGMVFGGSVGIGWLVLTGAMGQTDRPLGPAYANPGAVPSGTLPWTMSLDQLAPVADDLQPHVVTIAGVALVGFFALVATAMALIDTD